MKALGIGGAASSMGVGTVGAESHEGGQSQRPEGDLGTYDVSKTWVDLGSHVHGVLHEPRRPNSNKDHIAWVFTHPDSDFTDGWRNEITERYGYRSLGIDTSADIRGMFHTHNLLPELGRGVSHLRDHSDVQVVIIGGHSGGCHLSSMYQNVAENGIEIGQGDEKIYPYPEHLEEEEYPAADGLVLIDGHIGYGAKGVVDPGPGFVDPDDPRSGRPPEVDPTLPENGFDPETESADYPEEFRERYFQAQADRADELREENLDILQQIESEDWRYTDDDQFIWQDTRSRLHLVDLSLLAKTSQEYPLHHAEDSEVSDEPVTEGIVESNRPILGRAEEMTPPFSFQGRETEQTSVRTFLSTRSIRTTGDFRLTEDSVEGIDWHSSNAQTPGNLETISVPVLNTVATGFFFVTWGDLFHQHIGSNDKETHYVQGANHSFGPIDPKFGDTRSVVMRLWDRWVTERFC